jgi:O-antigen ligase
VTDTDGYVADHSHLREPPLESPPRGEAGGIVLLALGMLAAALVALPYKVFELDRYFVPKELALHACAFLLGTTLVVKARRRRADAADLLLAVFLVLSVAAATVATNHWLAQRAAALTASSAVVFWAARGAGAAGRHRGILAAGAIATVVAALIGLAQAYGFASDYFSINRAPGGTFGNRNFVAHFCAIGLPALVFTVLAARRFPVAAIGALGTSAVMAMLVLTRSRAAWLAVAASVVVALAALAAARSYLRGGAVASRLALLAVLSVGAVAAALLLPNALNWRSDSPYLETALGVADYESGSGRGRLLQYRNSIEMAAAHPILGVGPGNWPVEYVKFAPRGDESLASDGMTANPWPSSDWIAFVSERGAVTALALAGALAMLFFGALRRWADLPDPEGLIVKITLAATITATVVVSMFDAVLLLAAPSFLAWAVIGAASGVGMADASPRRRFWWRPAAVLALVLTASGVVRSATQVISIMVVGTGGSNLSWVNGAMWDPGSYRIAVRAAEVQATRGRCGSARIHASRARYLFPSAAAPRRVLGRCG